MGVAGTAYTRSLDETWASSSMMSAFGTPSERQKGCDHYVEMVQRRVYYGYYSGIEYHPAEEMVTMTHEMALHLGYNMILPTLDIDSKRHHFMFSLCRDRDYGDGL